MVIVVKTQIEKMYALPNTPYNYKISSNISLLFYKFHCLDLRFQTTPFRGWCRRSQILLYLELYNLEILQPKLHYLHFQFLRICKKHDTRIFPLVRVTSVDPRSQHSATTTSFVPQVLAAASSFVYFLGTRELQQLAGELMFHTAPLALFHRC